MRNTRIILVFAMVFFVLGIGAKDCIDFGGKIAPPPSDPSPSALPAKPFCYTDPPIGCAVFCSDIGMVSVTSQCSNIEANEQELAFEVAVRKNINDLEAQGIQVCPQATPTSFMTPCAFGIFPAEWPNQDHEFCQTPPLDCSIVLP